MCTWYKKIALALLVGATSQNSYGAETFGMLDKTWPVHAGFSQKYWGMNIAATTALVVLGNGTDSVTFPASIGLLGWYTTHSLQVTPNRSPVLTMVFLTPCIAWLSSAGLNATDQLGKRLSKRLWYDSFADDQSRESVRGAVRMLGTSLTLHATACVLAQAYCWAAQATPNPIK